MTLDDPNLVKLAIQFVDWRLQLRLDEVNKAGLEVVVLDDGQHVSLRIPALNKSIQGLGVSEYYAIDTRALFSTEPRVKARRYSVENDEWYGFEHYDDDGFSLRTTTTLFFSNPVRFLILREGGSDPVWICGPGDFLRSFLEIDRSVTFPAALGNFSNRPDIADLVGQGTSRPGL